MKTKIKLSLIVFAVLTLLSSGLSIFFIYEDFKNSRDRHSSANQAARDNSSEEYIWVAPMTEYSMCKNHDERALHQFSGETGINVTVLGPAGYDVEALYDAMEKAIARNPSGILVLAADKKLTPLINRAVEAGIPTITVDADLAESKRLAYVGSNWFNIGVKQGEAMVRLIGGKGKVAMMGIQGSENMEQGFAGFKSVMKDYPEVMILGEFDDMANSQESQRITEELLGKHPDIAGIAGFDSYSGPGIGEAVKKAKFKGRVKVTSVDMEPAHLALVKEGIIHKLIGQKRELFTYYGARLLYEINHSTITFTRDDKGNGIIPVPFKIDTGLIEIDQTNVFTIDSSK